MVKWRSWGNLQLLRTFAMSSQGRTPSFWHVQQGIIRAVYVLVIMLQAKRIKTGTKCDCGMNQLLQPNPGNPRGHSSVRARCLLPRTATSVQSWWAQGPPSARRLMMAGRRRQVSPCRMARVQRRPGFRRTGAAHVSPGAGVHQARAGQGHSCFHAEPYMHRGSAHENGAGRQACAHATHQAALWLSHCLQSHTAAAQLGHHPCMPCPPTPIHTIP